MKKNILQYLPSTLLLIAILLIWEIIVQSGNISPRILPSPLIIFSAFVTHWQQILDNSLQTITEAIIGLVISIMLGWIIAILIDSSEVFKKTIYPLLVTSQTIPMIALAPLLLLWFGFDILPKIIIVTLYCFFPIVIALAGGFSHVENDFLKLLQSMGASKLQIYTLVKIPYSLPYFFSGLKIAATYAIAGAIVGEYVGAEKGIGIFMQQAANSYAISLVFAGIFVTAVLSMGFVGIVVFIEEKMLSWNN